MLYPLSRKVKVDEIPISLKDEKGRTIWETPQERTPPRLSAGRQPSPQVVGLLRPVLWNKHEHLYDIQAGTISVNAGHVRLV